ncbi:MAG TPA: phosphatase PAP2 family protein [Terriglobales bacterium]|nr:phosphatase PAP2 family protein [Terriglobales bacterium]
MRFVGLNASVDFQSAINVRLKLWAALTAMFLLLAPAAVAQIQPGDNAVALNAAAESSSRTTVDGGSQPANTESFDNPAVSIGRTIGQDELHFLKAPFTKKAIPWDIVVLGGTAALAASDADENILHDIPTSWHPTSLNISDGALYGSVATVGGIYLTGLLTKNEHEQEVGMRTAEAVADSVILYGAMKVIVQRQRPYSGVGEGKFFAGNWLHGSFPSGHSMFTWTIASAVAHQYHSIPLDLLVYGLASTVSVTRVTAGQHFPSDVLVGTVLGYFVGDYVAHKEASGFPTRAGKLQRVRDALLEHVTIGVE